MEIQRAHIELDIAAIATGNSKRNSDLAEPKFLDTAQHPKMFVDLLPVAQGESGWHTEATFMVRGGREVLDVGTHARADV